MNDILSYLDRDITELKENPRFLKGNYKKTKNLIDIDIDNVTFISIIFMHVLLPVSLSLAAVSGLFWPYMAS